MSWPPNVSWPPTAPQPRGDDPGASYPAGSGPRYHVPGDDAAPDDLTIPALMSADTTPLSGSWGSGRAYSGVGQRTPPNRRRAGGGSRRRAAALVGVGALLGVVVVLAALLLAQLSGLLGLGGAPGSHGTLGLGKRPTATRAPTPTATPVRPLLQAVVGVTPNAVNLTTSGTLDWAHWGLTGGHDFDHKATGGGKISDYTIVGNFGALPYGNNAAGFTWSDGTPNASALNTTTGVYVFGSGSGFTITAPADLTTRTLTVYVGVYVAHGRLKASLSDQSAPAYADDALVNSSGATIGMYRITYRAASAGQRLTVTFTDEHLYAIYGNINLQAATLTLS